MRPADTEHTGVVDTLYEVGDSRAWWRLTAVSSLADVGTVLRQRGLCGFIPGQGNFFWLQNNPVPVE
jgi:hypothetical protein